jgi:hypothetical protein
VLSSHRRVLDLHDHVVIEQSVQWVDRIVPAR